MSGKEKKSNREFSCSGLGNIFMCINGGTRHGTNGCRRTYMSGRDLQVNSLRPGGRKYSTYSIGFVKLHAARKTLSFVPSLLVAFPRG